MSFNGEILEIFSRLPGKHLHKFASVCTLSNELLFDDFFIRKQCKNMQVADETDFFIKPDTIPRDTNCKAEIHALNPKTSMNISEQSLEIISNQTDILASSNGLLCCRRKTPVENPFFLFNPTNKSYLEIPNPDDSITRDKDITVVFECNGEEDNMDYTLMAILIPPQWGANYYTKIFSPEKMAWVDGDNINQGARNIVHEYSFMQNGVVYMISDQWRYFTKESPFRWPYIVAHDTKNSTSRFLYMPKSVRKGLQVSKLGIFKWGSSINTSLNSICLVKFFKNVFTVWELMESDGWWYYWNLVFKMRVRAMGLVFSGDLKVAGFTVVNGSLLLFATEEKVYKFDLKNGIKGDIEEIGAHNCGDRVRFDSFSSTLRPCIFGADRDEARN